MTRNPFQVALWPAGLYRGGQLLGTWDYAAGPLDLSAHFGRPAPLLVEIGPGRGHFLLDLATARPGWNLLGVEISRARSQSLDSKAVRRGLTNLVVLNAVAELALGTLLPPACAQELHIHFPDPWPKKRHRKRRLLGPDLAPRLVQTLAPGGLLCVMTDHEDYALEAIASLEVHPQLRNLAGAVRFASRPEEPETHYQRLSHLEGRPVHYIRMVREPAEPGGTGSDPGT